MFSKPGQLSTPRARILAFGPVRVKRQIESTHRYSSRRAERDAVLRARLRELAAKRKRFGYRRLPAMLMREGMRANHKRVYRLYS
ncbi:MAG: hypothetical protein DMG97_38020 [Acidobacteria bacterium]|nr:MAG: hypothetical protein DMG97_38020 [Acidobacteriota bacterium]